MFVSSFYIFVLMTIVTSQLIRTFLLLLPHLPTVGKSILATFCHFCSSISLGIAKEGDARTKDRNTFLVLGYMLSFCFCRESHKFIMPLIR